MFSIRRPTHQRLEQIQSELRHAPLAYCSNYWLAPAGFKLDQFECILGHGQAVFEAAQAAIRDWKMFPQQMVQLWPERASIEVGTVACVMFRAGLLWTASFCRIFEVIVDDGAIAQFGFTYATLSQHVERGQERFLVEWNCATDEVRYSIVAVSQPAHWLIWLGYPYARWQQSRFRTLSGQAMQAAVQERGSQ